MKIPIFVDNKYDDLGFIRSIPDSYILSILRKDKISSSNEYNVNLGNKTENISKIRKMNCVREYLNGYMLSISNEDNNELIAYDLDDNEKVITFFNLNDYDFDNNLDLIFNKPKLYKDIYDFYKNNKNIFDINKRNLLIKSYIANNIKLFSIIKDAFRKYFAININEIINYSSSVTFYIDKNYFYIYSNSFEFDVIIDINSRFEIKLRVILNKDNLNILHSFHLNPNGNKFMIDINTKILLFEIDNNIDKMKEYIFNAIKGKNKNIIEEVKKIYTNEKSIDKYIKHIMNKYSNDELKQIEVFQESLFDKSEIL